MDRSSGPRPGSLESREIPRTGIDRVRNPDPELLDAYARLHEESYRQDPSAEAIRAALREVGQLVYAQPPGSADRAPVSTVAILTGLQDDPRRELTQEDPLYRAAIYAMDRQETWTAFEHREYWEAHLHLWPTPRGRRPTSHDSIVKPLIKALELRVDPEEVLLRLGFNRNDGRWGRWLAEAQDQHELEVKARDNAAQRPSILLPYVGTPEHLDSLSGTTHILNLRAHVAQWPNDASANAAAAISLRASAIVDELFSERLTERYPGL